MQRKQLNGAPGESRVLIVEDDADISEMLATILEADGHTVDTAANGREALAWLRAPGHRPGLILLDLRMPIMDGVEFRRWQIKDQALADIPVVLLTAELRAGERAAALGVSGFLTKPFELDALLAAVAWYLRGLDRRSAPLAAPPWLRVPEGSLQ